MPELEQISLADPAVIADPYPLYQRMLQHAPVYWSEAQGGWYLFRHRDVMTALRDPRLSASRLGAVRQRLPAHLQAETALLFDSLGRWALFMDPPDHTRVRKLIGAAFTPRLVARMEPRIQALIDELLDRAALQGARSKLDIVRDFAYPLPTTVIAEMLGVPPEDRDLFKRWSDDIAQFFGMTQFDVSVMLQARQSVATMNDYVRDMLRARREARQDDLLSALVAARDDADMLSEDEVLATCGLLLFAGHETTTNLIANGLLALLRNPAELARLRQSPALVENAIEELMRYESPVQRISRTASEDLDWEGHRIQKGQRVFLVVGAAGRDPAVFPDPDRLDITRRDIRHLGFGFGPHFCVGAALGRLEARLAFATLLDRLPDLALATDAIDWQHNLLLRSMKALPVTFTA